MTFVVSKYAMSQHVRFAKPLRKTREYNPHPERPNYKTNTFCCVCEKNYPKGMIRCPDFNHILRHRPIRKSHLELPRY